MVEPFIDFQHVTFKYHAQSEPTLHDVSFQIYPGEKVLIAGASGSGKTTLLRLLNGLIPQAYQGDITGELTINGKKILNQSLFDLSLQAGTVLQDSDAQFVGMTVAEDIAFSFENDNQPIKIVREKVAKWANRFGLGKRLTLAPQSLSGGQKQRTAMAGVLVDEGDLLLFDEPLASLDPAAGAAAMALIDELQQDRNMTVVVIEHRIEDVLRAHVDRVIVMAHGRIVANDTPTAIIQAGVLSANGLDEPLYIQLLRRAGVPVNKIPHVADVEKVDVSNFRDQIETLAEPVQTVTHDDKQLLVQNLTFAYDQQEPLFENLSTSIHEGEILGIVGKNGSGKTTLSHLLTGFLTPSGGDIQLDGRSLLSDSIKERADHIGYVLQNPNHMITKATVFDEVASGLRLRNIDEEQVTERVREMLQLVDLDGMRNWPISALSFGQKKRLTIAAVLVLKPEILILDEPTAGQDATHTSQLLSFLQNINITNHTTIIIITHDMHLLANFVQRALVVVDGQILADTTPAELLANEALVDAASLRTTSIYRLAQRLSIVHPEELNAAIRK
ncbi:MAG: ABC transporter ATP-binding protein [Leuconostoc mesenteroides]|jgi:energy-coupling factor transport system ATP-binding protein|nr:ABC transporter ATP-binding protein [Leuconostoc mesenteroides]MCH3979180.1 ABC transporter ATP-binding protein [Leuconostoc mesenteroides]MCI2090275.1 ABC transporter ATP-binding protein [Leuconostoc mesenteroides]MCI2120978.1 ABC transporter ATP-binding protein [Leuconostoc mesenteroides]